MGTAIAKNGKGNKSAATGRLRVLESKIEKSVDAVWEMAEALKEIRDGALWKQTHRSWAEYCEDRWGITTSWARNTIEAIDVRKQLADRNPGFDLPVTHAARLSTVPEESREEIWEAAVTHAKTEGKSTPSRHRHLDRAIEEYRIREAPPPREPTATDRAFEAARDMRRSAEAFAINVERLIPHLDHLAEDEVQGCAYKIVETVHAVISTLQENGYLKSGVAGAILVDSTAA